ncbi:hypothetical protein H9P43_007661 [Blastocladiella emersonii ATCC 22665]|nr:hypothetical protein H9P43_007661 [Blastocladiella emersonii ATCC 22665]
MDTLPTPPVPTVASTLVTFDRTLCYDFGLFKDVIKELRKVDDNIHLKLNELPRGSAAFASALARNYEQRDAWIAGCAAVMDEELASARTRLAEEPKDLRRQNAVAEFERKKRLIANEATVEDILRDRTAQTVRRRCLMSIPGFGPGGARN